MTELISQTNELNTTTPQSIHSRTSAAIPQRKISVDVLTLVHNAKVLMKHNECSLAVQLLREALQKDSKNPTLLRTMAQGLDTLSRFVEAEKILSVLCIEEVTFANLAMKAHNYYKVGNDELALQSYFEALALVTDDQPELFEVHKNMGNIFVRRADFESAEEN